MRYQTSANAYEHAVVLTLSKNKERSVLKIIRWGTRGHLNRKPKIHAKFSCKVKLSKKKELHTASGFIIINTNLYQYFKTLQ